MSESIPSIEDLPTPFVSYDLSQLKNGSDLRKPTVVSQIYRRIKGNNAETDFGVGMHRIVL